MKITVDIPDGELCTGCKFLNQYCHKLIDIMGNETGNTREGFECKLYNQNLEEHEIHKGCFSFSTARKCSYCGMSEVERIKEAALWFWLYLSLKEKEESEKEE